MKRLFIINPKSGKGRDINALKTVIKDNFPQADIVLTERKNHARELAAQAVMDGYNQLIVSGGDGTINEAVQSLVGSATALGVIAGGSGNGLARELGCPLDNFDLSCKNINTSNEVLCDLGKANNDYFVNLAGLGIEADIAHQFDVQGAKGIRGKWPYFKIAAQEVLRYKAPYLEVELDDGTSLSCTPLTIVFANGRQYGSNFKIAPLASFNDGFLDMVIMQKANIARLFLGLPNFFMPGISPINITQTRKIKSAKVHCPGKFYYHIDGEPKEGKDILEISILPGSIKLLMN